MSLEVGCVQAAGLAAAGTPVDAVLSGVQLLVLALPFVGLLAVVGGGLRRSRQNLSLPEPDSAGQEGQSPSCALRGGVSP